MSSTAFENDRPRGRAGRFTGKPAVRQQAPLPVPPSDIPPDAVWAVEGDDHEVRLVVAGSVDEALDRACGDFTAQYGEEYDPDLLAVHGVFTGDPDDPDTLVFLPTDCGTDERHARRVLGMYDG